MPKKVLYAVAVMLLLGVLPLPYGYYRLLRLVAFIVFARLVWCAYESGDGTYPWIFGFAALLFNPIFPMYFSKTLWAILDAGAALLVMAGVKRYGE